MEAAAMINKELYKEIFTYKKSGIDIDAGTLELLYMRFNKEEVKKAIDDIYSGTITEEDIMKNDILYDEEQAKKQKEYESYREKVKKQAYDFFFGYYYQRSKACGIDANKKYDYGGHEDLHKQFCPPLNGPEAEEIREKALADVEVS